MTAVCICACVSKACLWPAAHELEIDSICVALRNIRSADTLNRGKSGSLSNWAFDGEQGFEGMTNYLVSPLKIHGYVAPFILCKGKPWLRQKLSYYHWWPWKKKGQLAFIFLVSFSLEVT